MTAKMKLVFITCALLAIAIGSFADGNPVKKEDNKPTDEQTTAHANIISSPIINNKEITTSVPTIITTSAANATIPSSSITPDTKANSTGKTTVPPNHDSTTAQPQSSTILTTEESIPSTVKPKTTATTPITSTPITSTPISTTTTKHTSTAVPVSSTTAGPLSTIVPTSTAAPPQERHFDGLSFLGGIIFSISLMAIGAFAWIYYRTTSGERNYRTL